MLIVSFTLGTFQTLDEISSLIASSTSEVAASTEELAANAAELASRMTTLELLDQEITTNVDNTGEILKFINEVAASSNLLGLNAAIKAARAGEHGHGFAVVAEEIRKMSNSSAESVNNIREILKLLHEQTAQIKTEIHSLSLVSERQAASAHEISAVMEQLTETANKISVIAKNLYKADLHEGVRIMR